MNRPRLVLALLLLATPAVGQSVRSADRPFEISDNSFLVEEAFNQEAGIFQNVLLVQRPSGREWTFEFTQEWPMGGQRHQFSYTVPVEAVQPVAGGDHEIARGTIAVHYRYQLSTEQGSAVATSPRLSVLFPRWPGGDRQVGVQLNLPLSKQFADWYVHANAGVTVSGIGAQEGAATQPHIAGSLIYRLWPMVHLVIESVYDDAGALVAPGVRAGLNLGTTQLVWGVAMPLDVSGDDAPRWLGYFSYELPFRR